MEYHKILKQHEQDTFIKSGESYKEILIKGLEEDRNCQTITNSFSNGLYEKENELFPKSDKEIMSLLNVYKKRSNNYSKNDIEKIIKNELLKEYSNSSVKEKFTYEDLAIKIGVYEGLVKSNATITNHRNYFSMLYKFDELENLVFTYDSNILNELEYELRKKHYPENSQNIIEMTKDVIDENNNKEESKDIILHEIKFNLYEFSLYQREWRDCNSPDTPFRELYDKILMDFNDPYKYGKKRYDTTSFYKALKDNFLKGRKKFDVILAYEKVEDLVGQTNNTVFKEHIRSKLATARFKLRDKKG